STTWSASRTSTDARAPARPEVCCLRLLLGRGLLLFLLRRRRVVCRVRVFFVGGGLGLVGLLLRRVRRRLFLLALFLFDGSPDLVDVIPTVDVLVTVHVHAHPL